MQSRRRFLTVASATLAGAALSPKAFGASGRDDVFNNATLGAYGQGQLTEAHFRPLLGSLFMLLLPEGRAEYLYLHKVTSMPGKGKAGSTAIPSKTVVHSFTLSFSTSGAGAPQETYVVDHGRLGRFAMFVVPGVNKAGSTTYEASFTSF